MVESCFLKAWAICVERFTVFKPPALPEVLTDDADGYTNVRSVGSPSGQIVDTIKAGKIFYTQNH
jgi:hypothetical protein